MQAVIAFVALAVCIVGAIWFWLWAATSIANAAVKQINKVDPSKNLKPGELFDDT